MAGPKATNLTMVSAAVNAINIIEQLRNLTVNADNTTVDGAGIADRYDSMQVTKQKQTVELMYHFFNSGTSLEATNLDITLWTLGGTSYLAEMKSGSLDINNGPIETSGIAETYEYAQTTRTNAVLTTNLMPLASGAPTDFMAAIMNNSVAGMTLLVSITFAGENIQIPGVLKSGRHTVRRGEVQMEDVVIEIQGTPTTPGDTTSLIYLALIGSALTSFNLDTGVNQYETGGGQFAAMTKYNIRFADKALIEQNLTLELQGGMVVNAGV